MFSFRLIIKKYRLQNLSKNFCAGCWCTLWICYFHWLCAFCRWFTYHINLMCWVFHFLCRLTLAEYHEQEEIFKLRLGHLKKVRTSCSKGFLCSILWIRAFLCRDRYSFNNQEGFVFERDSQDFVINLGAVVFTEDVLCFNK